MEQNVLQLVLRVRDEASKELQKFGGVVGKMSDNFEQNLAGAGTMAAGVVAALGLMTKSAITNAASYEQNRIAFETMLGSAQKAQGLLEQVADFAQKTPFELPQVVEGAKRLLAYGISGDKVIDSFKTLGDVAAGVGTDKLPALITAFGQVSAKGRLMGQELLQFTEAGVGLGGELQKMFHVSREELEDMIGSGKIGFSDVQQALQNMTSQGGLFFNGMERQSKSFNGMLSNINDSMGKFVRDLAGIDSQGNIREGSLFAVLHQAAEKFLVVIEKVRPVVTQFVTEMLSHKEVVIAIAGAIAGLLVLAMVALIAAIGGALIVMAEFAIIGAAVGLAVYYIIGHFQAWKEKAIEVIDYIKSIPERIGEFIVNTINWFIQLDANIRHFFIDLFLVQIPYAIGFAIGWLMQAIPNAITAIGDWFSSLPQRIAAGLSNFGNAVKNKTIEIGTFLRDEFSAMPGRISGFIERIPSIMADVFERAKQAVVDKINGIWNGIKAVFQKIGDAISGIVNAGGNFLEKLKSIGNTALDAAKSGFQAGQSFDNGGWVNYTGNAQVHQGEFVLSRDMLSGRTPIPSSVSETFNQPISIQAVINSETDLNLIGYRLAWALRNSR